MPHGKRAAPANARREHFHHGGAAESRLRATAPRRGASSGEASRSLKSLLPIFLIVLVDVFGFTLVIPLLSIYAESPAFRATPLQATALVSTYAVCQLVAGPFLGRLSDRVGRKPVLLVSQLGTMIGF